MSPRDNYDTPLPIATKIAALAKDLGSDMLEPAAGVGNIARYLPSGTLCLEIDDLRGRQGWASAKHCSWQWLNFLELDPIPEFDVVVTNPPFSKMMDYIEHGLKFLKPTGALVYLLPMSWRASRGRSERWLTLDAHIEREYVLSGRVDYDYNGTPMSKQLNAKGKRNSGRQETDAVYIIRPWRQLTPTFTYL